jgi:hypothetical protein
MKQVSLSQPRYRRDDDELMNASTADDEFSTTFVDDLVLRSTSSFDDDVLLEDIKPCKVCNDGE